MGLKLYEHACLLSNIRRFSGLHLDHPYTVAEHCFRVACLGMMIADEHNKSVEKTGEGEKVSVEEVMKKALLHDMEEAHFGDIPTPAKNYTPELRQAYKAAADKYAKDVIFSESTSGEYLGLWRADKEGLSGEIIKLCDRIEALSAAGYETRRGNIDMRKAHMSIHRWFEGEDGAAALAKFPAARPIYERAADVTVKSYKEDKKVASKADPYATADSHKEP
jgi:5'-deoxynucleotidase YfbR-like HD superfamily hydrolase